MKRFSAGPSYLRLSPHASLLYSGGIKGGQFRLTPYALRLLLPICLLLSPALAQPAPHAHDEADKPALAQLVAEYLKSPDPAGRAEVLKKINQTGASVDNVVHALQHGWFWEDRPANSTIAIRPGLTLTVTVPPSCKKGELHPANLRIAVPIYVSHSGHSSKCVVELEIDDALLPSDDIQAIVVAARKAVPIDSDALELIGREAMGNTAWSAFVARPDLFSRFVSMESYLDVPYPAQFYPLILSNTYGVPVVNLWFFVDQDPESAAGLPAVKYNKLAIDWARRNGMPWVGTDESGSGAALQQPVRRPPVPPEFVHWFRYPHEGRAWWIRQTKFAGDVWEGDQLSIVTSAGVDRDQFITNVLQEKLAFFGGRIVGQTLHIETRKCADIEVLFFDGMVDLDQPVTIIINERQRFAGVIKPDMQTMLERAYEEWDFQRPVLATKHFNIKP